MPSGQATLKDGQNIRHRVARLLATSAAPVAPEASVVMINCADILPEAERQWRGGRLRDAEMPLLFAPDLSVAAGRHMITACVPTVGAIFLVRALADGHVEAIPFGFDDDLVQDETTIDGQDFAISFLSQVEGPGFVDRWTGTVIADLAALRPFETARKLGDDAGRFLSELLLGPINHQLGNVLEIAESNTQYQRHPGEALARAMRVAAQIIDRRLLLHWRAPASDLGYPRLDGVTSFQDYLDGEAEDIVQALFMTAAEPVAPECVVSDVTAEPPHPWRPKQSPSYRFTTGDNSAHGIIDDVATLGVTWRARRADHKESWRYRRTNGQPISKAAILRIDQFLGGS